jgi:hypothetical protein
LLNVHLHHLSCQDSHAKASTRSNPLVTVILDVVQPG